MRLPLGGVLEERSLDLVAAVAHRRDVVEEREQAVVIPLQDRIDLVVVAPGAVDRQAKKHLPRGRDDVVEPVVAKLFAVGRLVVPHTQPVVAGGDQSVIGRVGEFIAGELFGHELVVRLVVVQRPNTIIAKPPGMGLVAIAFEGVGVGIPHEVEPVAGPPLTVVRAGEQPLDHSPPRLW